MGEAHVIDVRHLVGTTSESQWPASPVISIDLVKRHEAKGRAIQSGDVVIFFSGYSDAHFRPLPGTPALDRLFAAPLRGKAEGWPAPDPEVIQYLIDRGVQCVGTDGPTLGGAHAENALFVNWLAGSRNLMVVEFLTNVAVIADQLAFFIFAPIKIEGTRGGYGRALAFY
jgi:kynurenine formamidase